MSIHRHHIIPLHEWKSRINPNATRWDGEFNSPDNVVFLTPEQHIECHKWLWENLSSEKDRLAYLVLEGSMKIEEFRSKIAILNWKNRSRIMSQEQRNKMSAILKGNQRAKGNKFTPEQRQRVTLSRKGKKRGKYKPETKPRKTRIITQEYKDNIRKALLGKKRGSYNKN